MSHLFKPKSFEMQSGPGKHLDEKFNSYSLGSQSSRKFVPTLQLPDILAKISRKLPPEEVDKLIDEVKGRDGNGVKSVQRKRATKSCAFASQSRTEYYAAIQKKDRVPCTGYYTPKFEGIYANRPVPEMKQPREKPKTRKTSRASEERELEDFMEKAKTTTMFHLQLNRPDPTSMVNDVNEKRFEMIPEPEIYSKHKKVVTPNIGKILERKPMIKANSSPRYNPKFDCIWKKCLPTIDFGKLTGRIEDSLPPGTHLHYENIRFSQVSSKQPAVYFGSITSRPETGMLPSHMMKVNNRISLTVMQEGSLLMSGRQTADVRRSASVGRIL